MSANRTGLLAIVIGLIILNVVAHFLPFERAALGNDDYALVLRARRSSVSELVALTPRQPDRPLGFLTLMLQEKLVDDNPRLGLWLVFAATSAVLIAVFFFLRLLTNDTGLALIGAMIFCLLPNKLEVYQQPIFVYMELANVLYLASLMGLLGYAAQGRRALLLLSLAGYGLAVFIYPTGWLLPLSVTLYLAVTKRQPLRVACYFLLLAIGYLVVKFTNTFGFADQPPTFPHQASLAMLPTNLGDLVHHYGGRYLIRNVLYGTYKFPSIEWPWLGTIILCDLLVLFVIWRWLKPRSLGTVDGSLIGLSAAIFVASLIPILLNAYGGIGGRHLVLPSVGLSILGMWLLATIRRWWRSAVLGFAAAALVICQGNAWSQVVACRLNAAVYGTLKAMQPTLRQADQVILDTRSFADRIPFTWVQRDFNVLNTYYGAQAFESWGLASMAKLALGPTGPDVYIATERPHPTGDGAWEFSMSEQTGYRAVENKVLRVPQSRTVVIDFYTVFGEEFQNGRGRANS